MKRFARSVSWLPNVLLALLLCNIAQPVHAQSVPAFTCTGEIYQVQSGQLRIFDPISSSYQDVGSNQGSYNATGYNILDNYAYGSQGSNIIRIGSDGSTEIAFSGISGSYSGDVDPYGNFWLRTSHNAYRRINLTTGVVTTFNMSGPGGGPADVAFVESGGSKYRNGKVNIDI